MNTATLTTETNATTTKKTPNKPKETVLSSKAAAWCRKVAGVATKRIFRVKTLEGNSGSINTDTLQFLLLPKIYHRKRISHTDRLSKILLHPDFFDEKGNIRKKLPKAERDELKAAIFKEIAHFVAGKRPNAEFYKIMVRCPWTGPRVDGARGSETEARLELDKRRQKKLANKRTVTEVPTGLQEDVKMWSLTEGKHVLVKNAKIFLANGKIKIARGVHNGKKLRTMLPGGAALKTKLNL